MHPPEAPDGPGGSKMTAARGMRAKDVSFSAGADMAVLIFFVLIPAHTGSYRLIPGTIAVIAGFIIGIAASLPILAVASLTRLVGHEPPEEETD